MTAGAFEADWAGLSDSVLTGSWQGVPAAAEAGAAGGDDDDEERKDEERKVADLGSGPPPYRPSSSGQRTKPQPRTADATPSGKEPAPAASGASAAGKATAAEDVELEVGVQGRRV